MRALVVTDNWKYGSASSNVQALFTFELRALHKTFFRLLTEHLQANWLLFCLQAFRNSLLKLALATNDNNAVPLSVNEAMNVAICVLVIRILYCRAMRHPLPRCAATMWAAPGHSAVRCNGTRVAVWQRVLIALLLLRLPRDIWLYALSLSLNSPCLPPTPSPRAATYASNKSKACIACSSL